MAEAGLEQPGQMLARLAVEGAGEATVDTGLPVLDHLLALLVRYAGFDLTLEVAPDGAQAQITAAARALGGALRNALDADGRGHGMGAVPAGEALASVALDRSAQPLLVSNVDLSAVHLAGLETDVVSGFLGVLAESAGLVLHVRLIHGEDEREVLDSIFKALGAALGEACRP